MKSFLLALFIVVGSFFCSAQNPLVKQWDKRYGGNQDDELSTFIATKDKGYLLAGSSRSSIGWDHAQSCRGGWDYWIVKLDSAGVKQWEKRFGGASYDFLASVQQTNDGGYILGGHSDSDSSGDKSQNKRGLYPDYWIVKIDSAGNKQWDKRFGGFYGWSHLYTVLQTDEGGYILGGYSIASSGYDKTEDLRGTSGFADYWVVKTDAAGNKLWDKSFGGNYSDYMTDMKLTSDGGYILAGRSNSDTGDDKTDSCRSNNGSSDYWIVKIDATGNKQWDKTYGGLYDDALFSVIQTNDGGYYIAGSSSSPISGDVTQPNYDLTNNSSDFWAVKTDASGNKLWDKRYGGNNGEGWRGNAILTYGGGFLLTATSGSPISGDKTENNLGNNLGNSQVWAIKTDANGIKEWDKTIFTNGSDGVGYGVQSSDGCYAFANYTKSTIAGYQTQQPRAYEDYWMVKFCDTTLVIQCNLQIPVIGASQTTFCAGEGAQICAPANFTNYQWNTGLTTRCISATLAGTYYVSVTDIFSCSAESNHLAISVYPTPSVSTSVNGDTLSAYNGVTQQWYLNDSVINGATNNTYVAEQGGNYTVMITDSNGCTAISNPVIISGIESIAEAEIVTIYPNPINTILNIQTENFNPLFITISDINGKKISEQKYAPQIDVSTLTSGIYFIELKSSDAIARKRFVKM